MIQRYCSTRKEIRLYIVLLVYLSLYNKSLCIYLFIFLSLSLLIRSLVIDIIVVNQWHISLPMQRKMYMFLFRVHTYVHTRIRYTHTVCVLWITAETAMYCNMNMKNGFDFDCISLMGGWQSGKIALVYPWKKNTRSHSNISNIVIADLEDICRIAYKCQFIQYDTWYWTKVVLRNVIPPQNRTGVHVERKWKFQYKNT